MGTDLLFDAIKMGFGAAILEIAIVASFKIQGWRKRLHALQFPGVHLHRLVRKYAALMLDVVFQQPTEVAQDQGEAPSSLMLRYGYSFVPSLPPKNPLLQRDEYVNQILLACSEKG